MKLLRLFDLKPSYISQNLLTSLSYSVQRWHYVILDEGHVIKNVKTKVARAVKSLRADFRLVLSGTPIQNSAVELW